MKRGVLSRGQGLASRDMPMVERPAMADYGVPADLDGTLPWPWALERLIANKNYWVVTASASARPHAMPVWGVWLADDDQFWFSCATTARKARNLAENPQCAVTVDDTVECVSVEGVAGRIDLAVEAAAFNRMVAAYMAKYFPDSSEHAETEAFLRSNAVFAVTPERAFGVIEREDEFSRRATRWRW